MAEQNAAVPISPANMMAEALDKASQDLEKTVKACIDQLQSFNENVERSLSTQLNKLMDQSRNFTEGNIEDLATHREELVDRLLEFERSEIETMASAARDVRQGVSARAQQATDSISRLVEEQVAELRALIDNPEANFKDFGSVNSHDLDERAATAKERLIRDQACCELMISQKAQQLEQDVQQIVADSKKGIEETLANFNDDMEKKISGVLSQLSDVVQDTLKDLEKDANNGAERVRKGIEEGKARLTRSMNTWKDDCTELKQDFEDVIKHDSETAVKVHGTKLEQKVDEVKDEIEQISHDANAKITASHKLFHSSLKRLEKKYNDRLERLLTRFETAMAEEAKLSVGGLQPNHELREQMHNRLEDGAKEILKHFQRQVEQMEFEYARLSTGSHEKIEAVRSATLDGIDKHVRTMRGELERISRIFKTELSDLHAELPKIEERGRAAAMAVYAYRSTMLSFSGD